MRDGVAYVQDTSSSVYAIDLESGRRRWVHRRQEPNDGPNGLALVGDRLYAASDTSVFALDASDGQAAVEHAAREPDGAIRQHRAGRRSRPGLREHRRASARRPGSDLRARRETGKQLWRFDTIKEPWRNPRPGGGGAWEPLSVDGSGRVYAGIANPAPWGGSRRFPNGGWYRGQTLYTDSLVVLDGASGDLRLVRPGAPARRQGLRPPALAHPRHGGWTRPRDRWREGWAHPRLGPGHARAGLDAARWERTATTSARCPKTPVEVCPGLFGGALTPMAYADGRVFVPVVELCMRESAVTTALVGQRPPEEGTGVVAALDAATGHPLWTRKLPSAPFGCATVASDVVFVPDLRRADLRALGRDRGVLWSDRAQAGINGCPSVAGDTLLVPAGAPHRDFAEPVPQLIAYRLSSSE